MTPLPYHLIREYENESEVEEKYKRQMKMLDLSGMQIVHLFKSYLI